MKHLGSVIALLTAMTGGAVAQEMSDCDRLAANPFDHDAVAVGVLFEDLDAGAAIPACRAAVESEPDNLRFRYQLGRALDANGDAEESFSHYAAAAEGGYVIAMNALGRAYQNGTGVAADPEAALQWYGDAAFRGSEAAASNLGDIYFNGTFGLVDHGTAYLWYRRAADSGYLNAIEQMGYFHAMGLGVPVDYDEARHWMEIAYGLGSANAAQNLGYIHEMGLGVPADAATAAHYYYSAIERGDLRALGFFAESPHDMGPDLWRAMETLLAERGVADVVPDGRPDRDTILALIRLGGADEAATMAAFTAAMAAGATAPRR